jgi:hypothetical protein
MKKVGFKQKAIRLVNVLVNRPYNGTINMVIFCKAVLNYTGEAVALFLMSQ